MGGPVFVGGKGGLGCIGLRKTVFTPFSAGGTPSVFPLGG